jgi:predicted DNA-binding transcriptional regulator AlpA
MTTTRTSTSPATLAATSGAGCTSCCRLRRILGPAGVAALLELSERHLTDLRAEDPTFPTPRMCGRLPRWDAETIIAWVAAPAGTPHGAGSGATGQEHRTAASLRSTRRGHHSGAAGLV